MANSKKKITCDGNYAAAHNAYLFSEVSAIYPITPSSTMSELCDEWAAQGKKNIFGTTVKVSEMQSEAGAAGAVHGSLQAGALTTTFTSSQGLLLMLPNMYRMAGELLPAVLHVAARAVASQALSIFGDHQDVMAVRQAGFAMLVSNSVQEAMDIGSVAHLSTIKSRVPFIHFFDGFRTSHEIQKIDEIDAEALKGLYDMKALAEFRDRALNPEHPVTKGTAQNSDIYFQAREASNKFYDAVPDIVAHYLTEVSKITGRHYAPFTYFGAADAENVVIAMGSVNETIQEVVTHLSKDGQKVGVLAVHLYRPFSTKYFMDVLPKTVKRICVLDRTKEPGANGEPLYLDIRNVFYGKENAPMVIGGRYGLSSKDTTPAQILSVFENLALKEPRNGFTVGIVDDVTFTSLPMKEEISLAQAGTFEARFIGLGADGTVGANKNSIKIIGDSTDKYCQAYFDYDSKKSGGYTASHLRFGDNEIKSPYLVNTPDLVACHVPAYLAKFDLLAGLKKGGTFLLNSIWDEATTLNNIPTDMKIYMAKNDIVFYIINATKIAAELGLRGRTNTIMQSAFFKASGVLPYDKAVEQMKKAILKSYGSKGEHIVKMNNDAVDRGGDIIKVNIPASWSSLTPDAPQTTDNSAPEFIRNIVDPINTLRGNSLPISAFNGREDGTWDAGTTKFEKRGVAAFIPRWDEKTCIQCNQCAYVCPHAAIRPFLLTDSEVENGPNGMPVMEGKGNYKEFKFRIQVSPLDCTGCENCADVCPAPGKALFMEDITPQIEVQAPRWTYMHEVVGYKTIADQKKTVKSSQFIQPLFEFSGACAGCGETPYIKTVTQLFGDKMIIANATGCSSIYGGSAPSTPYTTNSDGHGPAWANSLFEDNAEFGFGINDGVNAVRTRLQDNITEAIKSCNCCDASVKKAMQNWLDSFYSLEESEITSKALIEAAKSCKCDTCKEILELKQYLSKKSIWVFGGDGWAYDIGFGGLDHVLASGKDINIMVLDTEVYSNTGGQASKSSPVGAFAKFASAGKTTRKKDLGMMMTSYGYIYVAQIALGANQNHAFQTLKEAEAFKGPSIVIAYSPCIAHGYKLGMTKTQDYEKAAVDCGYWSLWKYNPDLEKEGKCPYVVDSKEPKWENFRSYMLEQARYNTLMKTNKALAEELFTKTQGDAFWKYSNLKRLEKSYAHEKLEELNAPVVYKKVTVNKEVSIHAKVGDTLLQALNENNILLPSACNGAGTCEQCVFMCNGDGKEQLACQHIVEKDIDVTVRKEAFSVKKFKGEVISNNNVSTFIKELVIKLAEGEVLDFESGSYIQIDVPVYKASFKDFSIPDKFKDEWSELNMFGLNAENTDPTVYRAYSMANYPGEGNIVKLNVRIATPPWDKETGKFKDVKPGVCSSYLFGLTAGDKVSFAGTFGEFFLKDTSNEMLFIGGGAGMAPLRSHIFSLFRGEKKTTRKVSFWYGARSIQELFYVEEFQQLALENPNFRFHVVLSDPKHTDNWNGPKGFVHNFIFDNYLKVHKNPTAVEYYLCGPPVMIDATKNMLKGLEVPNANVMLDDFGI